MSWEGTLYFLCPVGHLSLGDLYNEPEVCQDCQAPVTYTGQCDVTNGYDPQDDDRENGTIVLVQPPAYAKCNMGHTHIVAPAIYRLTRPE